MSAPPTGTSTTPVAGSGAAVVAVAGATVLEGPVVDGAVLDPD
jgi:hypothetical protein